MITWNAPSTTSIARQSSCRAWASRLALGRDLALRLGSRLVELLQDRDGVAPQLGVLVAPVRLRELALLAVELRVLDLPVLGLLARLERGHPRVLDPPRRRLRLLRRAAKRDAHEPHDCGDDQEGQDDLHSG